MQARAYTYFFYRTSIPPSPSFDVTALPFSPAPKLVHRLQNLLSSRPWDMKVGIRDGHYLPRFGPERGGA